MHNSNNNISSANCELEFLAPSHMRRNIITNNIYPTHNELQNKFFLESISESDSDSNSDDEIKLEITDFIKGKERTKTVTIQQNSTKKRLLCFSVINNEHCNYGHYCTFAHTLSEQVIDSDMLYIYQIILDKNLMNFFSLSNPKTDQIYKKLLDFTKVCPKCITETCMGGYNCKYGTHDPCLKICKNDLLTGKCDNKLMDIPINNSILNKIELISKTTGCSGPSGKTTGCSGPSGKTTGCNGPLDKFEKAGLSDAEYITDFIPIGCMNGHHLSKRKLIPYLTYINEKNISKKTLHQSVRHINPNPICYSLGKKNYGYYKSSETSDSTDEEINGWFRKDSNSDEDIDI